MQPKLIFGRDPGLVLGLVSALVMFLSVFFLHLTGNEQGELNAVAAALVGALTMWAVDVDGHLALITGLAQSILALSLSFGLHWDPIQQTTAMTMTTMIAKFFLRTQMTVATPPVLSANTSSETAQAANGGRRL